MTKLHEMRLIRALIGLSLILAMLLSISAMSLAAVQASAPAISTTAVSSNYPPYPVNLYMFYRTDCPHCEALARHIQALQAKYPTLHVYQYETHNDTNFSLLQTFETAYGMKLLDTVPTVFVGKQSFVSDTAAPQIETAVAQAIQHGATGPGDTLTGHAVPTPTLTPMPSVNSFPIIDRQLLGPVPIPNSMLATIAMLAGLGMCLVIVAVIVARKSH